MFLRVFVLLGEVYFSQKISIYWIWLIDDTEFKLLFQLDSDVTRQNGIYWNARFSRNRTILSAHNMEKQNDRYAHRRC